MNDSVVESALCYVCGADLVQIYKPENNQVCLSSISTKFPQITLWSGLKKNVCGSCYKTAHECFAVYEKN